MLSRLRRVTRDGRWLAEIDGLRFVAISSVFLFHLSGELAHRSGRDIPLEPQYDWLGRLLGNGDRGVGIFFVISGLILALPFARQYLLSAPRVSLRRYYLRRLTRLEPPYVAAILIGTAMLVVYLHGPLAHLGPHVLVSLLYQHLLLYGTASWVSPVSWSLEVEVQFYVVAPLIMRLFLIRPTAVRRTILFAAILLLGLVQSSLAHSARLGVSLLFYLQYFLAGLLVADIFVLEGERAGRPWLWDVAGWLSLWGIFWATHEAYWPHATTPLLAGLVCLAAFRSTLLRRLLRTQWIAVLGGMCYSIYLLHYLFIAMMFKVTRRAILSSVSFPVNLAIQVLVTGLPVLLLCTAFFVLIERPCMDPDWPSKLWHRLTGRSGREVKALDTTGVSE